MSAPVFHVLPGIAAPISPSSHASEAGGFVFITGQLGRDLNDPDAPLPDGIEAQTQRALANLAYVLQALGLGMRDLVSVRVFLTHFKRDYAAMNGIYAGHFATTDRPTRTCIGVTDLARDALVEIDGIAFRRRGE